jgi:hypothetical protein
LGKLGGGAGFGVIRYLLLPVAGRRSFSYWRWEKIGVLGKRPRGKQRGEHEPYEVGRDVTGDVITVILVNCMKSRFHFLPVTLVCLVMEFSILRAANSAVHPVAHGSLPLHARIVCTCAPQKILPRRLSNDAHEDRSRRLC